ncbi:MAG: arsenosugar biosynthesis radical SAM protein ArsS [Bdellovibrionales bacterium]|nr:arsenosugar biosynthesis radical SAM protein ArsS [Bdellovibrionales bacterium]
MAIPSFYSQAEKLNLNRMPLEILQVNIGKRCNQACHHCHVESGPLRTENMESPTAERLIELLHTSPNIHTVDITGGAPELNPNFKKIVVAARRLGKKVIDRCNLTVFKEPGQEETPFFLKEYGVHVIASLPCYSKNNVEKQRGHGVFAKSINALQLLNELGYAKPDSGLTLDLVYNPTGPFLPPAQAKLEQDYKLELKELFNIEFNSLYTITNMPIKRFLDDLNRTGKLEEYMELLANSYNPMAAKGIMCRNLISVAWNGELYDCDFNQMLELPLGAGKKSLWDLSSFEELTDKPITFANHCYACTAGAGSSCGGALT